MGKKKGKGTYKFRNGSRYEGEFNNNKQNGKGTLFDYDGTIYIG